MHQINIDEDVWERLKQLAIPFEDREPNDVLRRLLKLENKQAGHFQNDVKLTRKARGKIQRDKYVAELKRDGLPIELVDGVFGKLKDGAWIAIPFARERKTNRWFLGLSEKDLRQKGRVFIALLCQYTSGTTFDIVIPPDLVVSLLDRLSKSKGKGQVKFNLKKIRDRYQLVIPRSESLDVSNYLDNRSLLKQEP